MRLAAPFGFYGAGNVGDEATLLGFAQLIRQFGNGIEIDVATCCVNQATKVEPYFKYYQYFDVIMGLKPKLNAHLSEGYIFGGGTPISDSLGDWPLSTVAGILEHGRNWRKPTASPAPRRPGVRWIPSRAPQAAGFPDWPSSAR